MLSVAAAQERILNDVTPNPPSTFVLSSASGLVLAESPIAELDMPPFDKAAVDGYAVVGADANAGSRFAVIEDVLAGATPSMDVAPGRAIRIMTGAPVPPSADTVVMLEFTRAAGDQIEVTRDTPTGRNICRRAEDMRAGEPLVPAGTILGPQHAALLAGQGCTQVRCHSKPTIAVLATGDEVVGPEVTPGAGQIRNANNAPLMVLAAQANSETLDLGIAPDEPEALQASMRRGLESQVLIISGGVSAGTVDLVPEVGKTCGVEAVFHHAALQPGRPVFYGRCGASHFFGLPGNPVAAFVCFKVLVEPLIRRLLGFADPLPRTRSAVFEGTFKKADERQRYVGVELIEADGVCRARKVPTHGPADVGALARSTGLAILPPDTGPYQGGEPVQAIPL